MPGAQSAGPRDQRPVEERGDVLVYTSAPLTEPTEVTGPVEAIIYAATDRRDTDFTGHGEIQCQAGLIVLNMGDPFTGINWTNDFPKMNYEVAFDAMRILGSDFFCGLTVPVSNSFCSLIVGGWGGSLVGISSLDSMDASENETTRFTSFDQNRWYRIRLRVTDAKLEAWIDKDKIVDVVTTDKRISVRPGDIELSKPFGLSCWQTTAALREIKMRPLNPAPLPTVRNQDPK